MTSQPSSGNDNQGLANSGAPGQVGCRLSRTVGTMKSVLGSASIQRAGWLGFPSAVLARTGADQDPEVLAQLGRDGWLRVFFGRGRRVELPDGTAWRIRGGGMGGQLVPVVMSPTGKLAVGSSVGKRVYGINGRDYGYSFFATRNKGFDRSPWLLTEYDRELATFSRNAVQAAHPVPLAAVLLCFTLIKYGVPGEEIRVPEFSW